MASLIPRKSIPDLHLGSLLPVTVANSWSFLLLWHEILLCYHGADLKLH